MDTRDYSFASDVIEYFGIKSIMLMTNNPEKIKFLVDKGINVKGRIPIFSEPTPYDKFYLETKKNRLGHEIENI